MTNKTEPIYSLIASNPDYSDLVKEFVSEFPSYAKTLRRCVTERNLVLLKRTIHQLRGACGAYGFPSLTESAGNVEEKLRGGHTFESVQASLSEFLDLLTRATAEKQQPG